MTTTILSFRRDGPRLRSVQLKLLDDIQVVDTTSHQIVLLVDFRGLIDGEVFLREYNAQWWVGGILARVVRAENTRLFGQVRVVLEPEDITHERFFAGVDWSTEIPDSFSQDPKSPDYDPVAHAAEAAAYTAWVGQRSIELRCPINTRDQGVHPQADLIASVVHPRAPSADWFNQRSRRLRTGRDDWRVACLHGPADRGPSAA